MDFLFSLLGSILSVILQIVEPMGGAPDPNCDPMTDPNCQVKYPITGGILYLLVAAIGLGVKKYSDKNKKNNLHE